MLLQTLEPRTLFAFGDLDPTFGSGGRGTIAFGTRSVDTVYATMAQPDGKVLVAGSTIDGFGGTDLAVARLNPDTSLDQSFGVTLEGGVGGGLFELPLADFNTDNFFGVDIDAQGRIVLVGSVADLDPLTGNLNVGQAVVIRLMPNGTPDFSFGGGNGFVLLPLSLNSFGVPNSEARAVGIQSTGKIVIGGAANLDPFTGSSSFALARLNEDGSLDTTFGEFGTGIDVAGVPGLITAILGMDIASDDKIVFTGTAIVPSDGFNPSTGIFVTARTTPDGFADNSFGDGGVVVTIFPESGFNTVIAIATTLKIQPDNKILVGGFVAREDSFGNVYSRIALARYDQFGNLDQSFGGGTFNEPGTVETLFSYSDGSEANLYANQIRLQSDGSFFISGKAGPPFSADTNGAVVARYLPNGALDQRFSDDGVILIFGDGSIQRNRSLSSKFSASQIVALATNTGQATGAGAFVENIPGGGLLLLATGINNALTAARLIPDGADLLTTTSGLKAGSFLGGAKGTVKVTFSNQGNATFSGSVPVKLFLSTDGAVGGDIPITSTSPVSLSIVPGTSQTFTIKFVYPKGSNVNGNYFVLATANDNGTVGEGNTVNNASIAPTQVGVKPAFVELAVTLTAAPAVGTLGKKAAFAVQVTNSGTVASKGKVSLQLFASTDGLFGGDALLAGGKPLNVSLKPGSKTYKLNGLIPGDLAAGSYILLIRLDATGVSDVSPIREVNSGKSITVS